MKLKNKKLADFEALLFDIDGTLRNLQGEISEQTIKSIKKLAKRGLQLGVCTGRGTSEVLTTILDIFPQDSLHITDGGSTIVDSQNQVLWHQWIDEQAVKETMKLAIETKTVIIVKKHDGYYAQEDFDKLTPDQVTSIYLTNLSPKMWKFLDSHKKLSYKQMVNRLGKPYVDITAKGINKAVALKEWSKRTNITPDKIIGFGDSLNDVEFLKVCGFSVVMGNGVEELKQIADRVIGHTDENGLANYLLKIMKGNNL